MSELVAAVLVALLSFGMGIFYVLSCIEKSVWVLMLDANSPKAADEDARFVHASLKRLIPLLPPTMGVIVGLGTICMLTQAWLRDFDLASMAVIGFFWIIFGYILTLGNVVGAVKAVIGGRSDAEASVVRRDVRRLVKAHHLGLLGTFGTVVLQLMLIWG